ncbi:MAG: hypothetical protein CL927_06745 [Deltaproteobacteria bacterium]|nr:hypothetical protein [Deltaproteobacteria bacterium]HCH65047.1 hypothetical protein [Deltaproteobacteria bacterium]
MLRIPPPILPVVSVVRDAAGAWSRHGSERLAASLSFYTLFSLAPILMVVTAIFGAFLGEAVVHTHLSDWLVDTAGPEAAATIMELVANADRPRAQAFTAVIGMGTIALAATRTFDHFQGALNTIWEVDPMVGKGVLGAVLRKLLSFGLVLSIGMFVVLSVTVGASLQGLAEHLAEHYAFPSQIAVLSHQGTNLVVLTMAFGAVYRFVPARKESWTNVMLGGLVTSVLFTLGKHGIAVYLGRTSATSAYGASGSLVMLLLWMYYSAMIVLGGAELTQAIARYRRSRNAPRGSATDPLAVASSAPE